MMILLLCLSGCLDDYPPAPSSPYEESAVGFVKGLINPGSGLVASRMDECFTTIYKNSLAAMVFLHEGNHKSAEAVFDVFNGYYMMNTPSSFTGFPKDWNPCTGQPEGTNFWEGDNAFLLLALNYYRITTNNSTRYASLSQALIAWLTSRTSNCQDIVAEGVANMYAALKPHATDPAVTMALDQLKACYFSSGNTSSVAYANVLDHTVRSALVFGDQTGYDYLPNFRRTETWIVSEKPVDAYSAFSGEAFINVEISAQLWLTGKVHGRTGQTPRLQTNLEALWITNGNRSGLPYYLTNIGFNESATLPIIDPTAYMLFSYWGFNPWSPGQLCADCP